MQFLVSQPEAGRVRNQPLPAYAQPRPQAPPAYNPFSSSTVTQRKAPGAPPVYAPFSATPSNKLPQSPYRPLTQPSQAAKTAPPSAPAILRPAVQRMHAPAAIPGSAPRASAGVVQRLVYQISDDDLTRGSYRHLTNVTPGHVDTTGSLRPVPDINHPFATLMANESLHLIIHGSGGTVEGMDPTEFADFLMARGLDPDLHRGVIRLLSCFSGTPDSRGRTFVERFAEVMRGRGFTNQFIGFNGLVRAAHGAAILVVRPENTNEFFKYSGMRDILKRQFKALEENKPVKGDSKEKFENFFKTVENWEKKFAKVNSKQEALWERQRLGHNIVLVPEVTHRDLPLLAQPGSRAAARRWEDSMHRQMVGMNLIKPGESIRPRTDYSSSYIS